MKDQSLIVSNMRPDDMIKMVDDAVERRIDDKLKSIEQSLTRIERVLLGDNSTNEIGLKKEHDEMYASYAGFKWMFKFLGISNVIMFIMTTIAILSAFGVFK